MKKTLSQLTKEEFETLRSLEALEDVFPSECSRNDSHLNVKSHREAINIIRKTLACRDEYDIIKLRERAQRWLNEYDSSD
jgi:hypothetical protein